MTQDSQALVPLLAEAREKLDGLARDLSATDAELEALSAERRQHKLLGDACGALEQLRETGGAELFWGDRVTAADEQIRRARGRVDAFDKRVSAIDDRRHVLVEQIRHQEYEAGVLEDDLFDAQEEEELRKLDWIIERELGELPTRELVMPWTRRGEDDRRYRRSLAASLLVCLLLALVFPFVDLPLPEPGEVVEVPDRIVRMMMKERPRPPAPPREEVKPEVKEPEQQLAKEPVEKPVPRKPVENKEPEPVEVAKSEPEPEQGILAFREKLSAFKEARVTDRIGLKSRINDADDNSAGRPQRSMLTSNAPGSSGGINLASISRNAGGGGGGGGSNGVMKGVQVGRATSSIGGVGTADRPLASGGRAGRTDEEIQIVFDRYKAALYRLYNRELRKDPTLRGQMVLRLTIEPDGRVSLCQLQASDMNAPELSTQVVDRVRTINFGAKDVDPITILYPIDFLPAA